MISQEPFIRVGLLENAEKLCGAFEGKFRIDGGSVLEGAFEAQYAGGEVILNDNTGKQAASGATIICGAEPGSRCRIRDLTIGRKFHWERKEEQIFGGNLIIRAQTGKALTVINEVPLEEYLTSVISSEMNASAPSEFLQAHAIISRSWLLAMMEKKGNNPAKDVPGGIRSGGEYIRWYDREEHSSYDVCADDHCQRYHGRSRIHSESALDAIRKTRGLVLVYGDAICDARYSKCCGGRTEEYGSAWEDIGIPYLSGISDSSSVSSTVANEEAATEWILSEPDAYCRVSDESVLGLILPSFDREKKDFYRWRIAYGREELERIVAEKSGMDFGTLTDILPVQRGSSGRIIKLKIVGTNRTLTIGKELEIRRWLSESHLRSSAFVVDTERDEKGVPRKFIFNGAGWGHGVGLCQIGAAVLAMRGDSAGKILGHYYRGASLKKLYK